MICRRGEERRGGEGGIILLADIDAMLWVTMSVCMGMGIG
jgi:hypothetical protein